MLAKQLVLPLPSVCLRRLSLFQVSLAPENTVVAVSFTINRTSSIITVDIDSLAETLRARSFTVAIAFDITNIGEHMAILAFGLYAIIQSFYLAEIKLAEIGLAHTNEHRADVLFAALRAVE